MAAIMCDELRMIFRSNRRAERSKALRIRPGKPSLIAENTQALNHLRFRILLEVTSDDSKS